MFMLLHGTDEFTAHEELARLKADPDLAYGIDTFSGMESSLESILASCNTLPFFSSRRLVVVEGLPRQRRKEAAAEVQASGGLVPPEQEQPSKAVAARKRRVPAHDFRSFTEALARQVPQLPESTLLVVVAGETLDASNPLVKAAKSYGTIHVYNSPRGAELESWLINRARMEQRELTREAARLLARDSGDSLRSVAVEIEKLSTYVGPGGRIGMEEVRALTPASQNARIFDLTDALSRRDRTRGLSLLHELLESGESPVGIVALTAGQTRSLIQIKVLGERGLRMPAIAQITGIAPFLVQKLLPLVHQFSLAELEATHRRLRDIDYSLKRSKMTPEMALDLLVIEFGTGTNSG